MGEGRFGTGKPFKFNHLWLRESSFNSMVKAVWSDITLLIPDDAQGNLIRKLSTLKNQTILWLRNKKKREQAEILSIELELELYQKQKL